MINLFNLNGEVAVVLGGTGVLGGAMAEAMAAAGATVVVVGRNAERGAERVKAIEKAGGTAGFQRADAMSRESLIAARDAILKQFNKVTVLVNGAGGNKPEATIMPGGDFCKLPLEGWGRSSI
jgi:NAD(P)-dependent dehydrogenase (short-subunit alcohol dehydrogenase family)